eukprot:365776-Chlamydomonas_euryale.AAC.11
MLTGEEGMGKVGNKESVEGCEGANCTCLHVDKVHCAAALVAADGCLVHRDAHARGRRAEAPGADRRLRAVRRSYWHLRRLHQRGAGKPRGVLKWRQQAAGAATSSENMRRGLVSMP